MTTTQAKVIVAFAKNNMNVMATTRDMFVHSNSVYYYIYKTIEETGLDPRNFYNLCELLPMANAVLEEEHDN